MRDQSNRPPKLLPRDNGHYIAYHYSYGRPPGIVFLGGFTSNMNGIKATHLESWCKSKGRAFVRFDYFGHGESSGAFAQATIGRWAEDAIAVIDNLTQGPQVLVGSSMGGWMMLLTALVRPQRIVGLVGIAAAADLTENLLWARMDQSTRQRLRTQGTISLPSDDGAAAHTIGWNLITEGRNHLLLQDTIALTCPTRLLHGMGDTEVPWETSLRIAQKLASQDTQVILIKDGDHRLSRTQDLNLITNLLATFPADAAISIPS